MPPDSESPDPNERFRQRREKALKRRRRQHRTAALIGCILAAAVVALGATVVASRGSHSRDSSAAEKKKAIERTPLPAEVRGVHVTMALANEPGKLDEYLAIPGLNAIELDVKDENGKVGFLMPAASLAGRVGASQPYYEAAVVAAKARAAGVYLIGRVVVFEDPTLTAERPDMAIQHSDGSVWVNDAGLGWANPYDKRVWKYVVGIGEAAARAGFDEIQFDYVRFPSDGPIESAVFPSKTAEPMGWTIARFAHYATRKLHPLGVRVSVDVFGLSATHDLGIGQVPGRLAKYVDAVYPMVYPSHYNPGEFNLPDPSATPGPTVALSLRDFRNAMVGSKAMLIPWLEDFSLTSTHPAPEEVRAQIEAARRYHTKGFLLWNPEGVYTEEVLK
ncbi:MAG TPA: putative glycoside hydrolase [Gaiellaceae bacterium]